MADTWPDGDQERQMLADADLCAQLFGGFCASVANDCACHVRALLERVRTLEKERNGLASRLEAVQEVREAMAKQIYGERYRPPRREIDGR